MGSPTIRAICLVSGGLDSSLAARLVLDQGIGVVGLTFVGPFGGCIEAGGSAPARVAHALGIPLIVEKLGEEYLDIVSHPRFGYGRNVNPCIDCHIYMFSRAKMLMEKEGASFVVTGEVLGQRPMSQRLDTLRKIERESGLRGLLLRPLSAKLLDPTKPEMEGWVNREDLLAISGRSRKQQMGLAAEMGVKGFSPPAGGCLLTDPRFADRVRDALRHGTMRLRDAALLSVGRHFRLPGGSKLIVGRNKAENDSLFAGAERSEALLVTDGVPGPTALLSGPVRDDETNLAARIVARYSDGRLAGRVGIRVESARGTDLLSVEPLGPEEAKEWMV